MRRGIAGALVGLLFATAFPSPALATTVNVGQTLDLGGVNQTVISLSGGGIVTNSGPPAATLTNEGPSSTFSGVIEDGGRRNELGPEFGRKYADAERPQHLYRRDDDHRRDAADRRRRIAGRRVLRWRHC